MNQMRFNNSLFGGLLCSICVYAQLVHTYVPEVDGNSARGIPASFEMTGPLPAHWSGSDLIGVEDNHSSAPVIFLIDRNGRRDQFSFSLPDAETIYVHGLALNSIGSVAIAGGTVSGDSKAGSFLALVAPDRKSQRVVRTWPYVPWEVVFVPDGSLWTVGYTFHDTEDRVVKLNMLSHFDREGKLLGSLPVQAKSQFPSHSAALTHSFLRTSFDRMGWFTNGMQYIEFSFDGKELSRYEGPDVSDPAESIRGGSFGLSSDNEVLFSTIENASIAPEHAGEPLKPFRKTWVLDRERRQWVQLQIQDDTLPGWSTVLGFDGQTLTVTGNLHEIRRYKRTSADSIR
jgi:hypothetical protein